MKTRRRVRSTKPRTKGRMPRSKGRRTTKKRKLLRGGGKKYVQEVNKLFKNKNTEIDNELFKKIKLLGIQNLIESKLFTEDEKEFITGCKNIFEKEKENEDPWRGKNTSPNQYRIMRAEENYGFLAGGQTKNEYNNVIKNGVQEEIGFIREKQDQNKLNVNFDDFEEKIKPECKNIAVWGIAKLTNSSHMKPEVLEKIKEYMNKQGAKPILHLNPLNTFSEAEEAANYFANLEKRSLGWGQTPGYY